MTNFQAWLKDCEINHTTVCELEKSDMPETGLYKLINSFKVDGKTYYNPSVYFVWVAGWEEFSGLSEWDAFRAWERYGTEMELYGK